MRHKTFEKRNLRQATLIILAVINLTACSQQQGTPMIIHEQGSFAVGGSVLTNPGTFDVIERTPEGQTFHGDHAYVYYQIPAKARKYPLVMWHGFGQFSKTWETTPDGREGFQLPGAVPRESCRCAGE